MFERFTAKARRVVVAAQKEAKDLEHDLIRPEHLLLGLVKEEGLAANALQRSGVRYEEVRGRVAAAFSTKKSKGRLDRVPFSPDSKKSLELSLREALQLGHNYIGTEHILLGVIRKLGDSAGAVLGVDAEAVKAEVMHQLEAATAARKPPALSPAVQRVMEVARQDAGSAPLTTAHLFAAVARDPDSQAAKVLVSLGVDLDGVTEALARIPVAGTSDASDTPPVVEIRIGGRLVTVPNAEFAAVMAQLSPEEIAAALVRAVLPESSDRTEGGTKQAG